MFLWLTSMPQIYLPFSSKHYYVIHMDQIIWTWINTCIIRFQFVEVFTGDHRGRKAEKTWRNTVNKVREMLPSFFALLMYQIILALIYVYLCDNYVGLVLLPSSISYVWQCFPHAVWRTSRSLLMQLRLSKIRELWLQLHLPMMLPQQMRSIQISLK